MDKPYNGQLSNNQPNVSTQSTRVFLRQWQLHGVQQATIYMLWQCITCNLFVSLWIYLAQGHGGQTSGVLSEMWKIRLGFGLGNLIYPGEAFNHEATFKAHRTTVQTYIAYTAHNTVKSRWHSQSFTFTVDPARASCPLVDHFSRQPIFFGAALPFNLPKAHTTYCLVMFSSRSKVLLCMFRSEICLPPILGCLAFRIPQSGSLPHHYGLFTLLYLSFHILHLQYVYIQSRVGCNTTAI